MRTIRPNKRKMLYFFAFSDRVCAITTAHLRTLASPLVVQRRSAASLGQRRQLARGEGGSEW